MATVITATQIYEIIQNNKIIDNVVDKVNGEEDTIKNNTNQTSLTVVAFDTDGNFLSEVQNVSENIKLTPYINGPIGPDQYNEYSWYYWVICDIELNANSFYFQSNNNLPYPNLYLSFNIPIAIGLEASDWSSISFSQNVGVQGNITTQNGTRKFIYVENENDINLNSSRFQSIYIIINEYTTTKINARLYVPAGWIARQSNSIGSSVTQYEINGSMSLQINTPIYEAETNEVSNGEGIKDFDIETNEFYQTGTTYNGTNIFQNNSQNIINEWSKGKETATLKCSIGEYYDESGNLVVSTQNNDLPMTFNIRDLVIPYIPIARGGTEPMSIRQDGKAKIFQVTQVRPYFDGACWQEIMLQEANESGSTTVDIVIPAGQSLYSYYSPYYIDDYTIIKMSPENAELRFNKRNDKTIDIYVTAPTDSDVSVTFLIKYSLYK